MTICLITLLLFGLYLHRSRHKMPNDQSASVHRHVHPGFVMDLEEVVLGLCHLPAVGMPGRRYTIPTLHVVNLELD